MELVRQVIVHRIMLFCKNMCVTYVGEYVRACVRACMCVHMYVCACQATAHGAFLSGLREAHRVLVGVSE